MDWLPPSCKVGCLILLAARLNEQIKALEQQLEELNDSLRITEDALSVAMDPMRPNVPAPCPIGIDGIHTSGHAGGGVSCQDWAPGVPADPRWNERPAHDSEKSSLATAQVLREVQ